MKEDNKKYDEDGLELNEVKHDLDSIEEKQPKKKKRKKKKVKNIDKKENEKLKLKALQNFMLWDSTFVSKGDVVEVPKPYAERLLTHTPRAFIKA